MSLPVISVAQMRAWEQSAWRSGQTEQAVIRRVGRAVATRALQLTQPGNRILVLAGKGHNGDDARAAIEWLTERQVDAIEVADPKASLRQVASALTLRPQLILDGLFGIGLNRPLDNAWIRLIKEINGAGRMVLSIDTPSGLDADTGLPQGGAVEAAVTLTIGAPKRGLLAASAWSYTGRLEVAGDVGLGTHALQSDWQWTLPSDFTEFPPARRVADHKGSFGHLAIIAGSLGFHGAAVLTARGAQRAQPGLITVITPESSYPPVAAALHAPMVSQWPPRSALPAAYSAILIGPGLAAPNLPENLREEFLRLWRQANVPMVVDASALDWLAPMKGPRGALRVITPHPGEAARMLKISTAEVQANRVQAVRKLSRSFGNCWVVLKGHQTLIGQSKGAIFVNPSGNPHLAQGGSGDVLAGFIAGWLAQPAMQKDPELVLRYAVWQHGAAADLLQSRRHGWTIDELCVELGGVSVPR